MVIGEDGQSLGTFAREVALDMAATQGKDLIQIAYSPKEFISTAKLGDYGRFMYNKQKELKEKKKSQKAKGLKEITFRYTIGENDLQLKVKKAVELLDEGYTVKFVVKLKGRERIYADALAQRLKGVEANLADVGKSQGVRSEPHGYSLILFPKSK